jgi:thymidylate synthase
MVTTMRSNDAYLGLPHDVFCFTMLQEIIARSLGREIGI